MEDILSDHGDGEDNFVINQKYARRFEKTAREKDLARAQFLESDSDSEDESEDDDGELLSADLELKILRTINSIRKKDPAVYSKDKVWFEESETDSNSDKETEQQDNQESSRKKKKYKDVLRDHLLSSGADDGNGETIQREDLAATRSKSRLAYDQEQESIRKQFLSSINNDNNESDNDDGLLTVRKKDAATIAKENEEIERELQEMKKLAKKDATKHEKKTAVLEEDIDVDDFLANYIKEQKWKDRSAPSKMGFDDHENQSMSIDNDESVTEDKIINILEEDEVDVDTAEVFESKYNFRFEELEERGMQDQQVAGHARNVVGSLRRVDDKRKIQRQMQQERKEKEKRQKEAEMRRLKNLKKQELQERLRKISEIGGLRELGLDESALDEEWDPAQHDALMAKQFSDEYYQDVDGEIDDSEEINEWLLEDTELDEEEDENDNISNRHDRKASKSKKKNNPLKNIDIEKLLLESSKNKSASGTAASSMLDELYQLDYEDIVAGIPCRFKYKEVEPEDFGLSTEDILLADDKELNSVVSLKKLSAYNTKGFTVEEKQKIAKRRKKLRQALKERKAAVDSKVNETLPTADMEVDHSKKSSEENLDANIDKKRKRKRHKSKSKDDDDQETMAESSNEEIPEIVEPSSEGVSSKKQKKHKKNKKHAHDDKNDRLKLYE